MGIVSFHNLVKDDLSGAFVELDFEHYNIHRGVTWHGVKKATLASGASTVFLFRPSTTLVTHLKMFGTSQLESELDLFKNPEYSASGTVFTASNKLTSGGDPTSIIRHSATITASGTLLDSYMIGSSGGAGGGGEGGSRNEWPNDVPGTEYLIRLRSGANTNLTSLLIEFYESGDI